MNDHDQKIVTNTLPTQETTAGKTDSQELLSKLRSSRELFEKLGDEWVQEQKFLGDLESRLISARFHLAVLGQFKRGKSTLLNALLGEKLLPSAVVPLTSIPTFLSWGQKHLIKIFFTDGSVKEQATESHDELSAFLERYVTESNNANNHLGVERVEVAHPSPLLQKGVILIDTPGIGSTLQHNTEATLNFLPQCDGALFLISADPPITQVEIEFLREVHSRVAQTILILNKVDYLSNDDQQSALTFFKKVLNEQLGLNGEEPVFCVSAKRGLKARLEGDDTLWVDSGMSQLEDRLTRFFTEEKSQALNIAVAQKAAGILNDGLLRLRLKRRSLILPLEDLEERLNIFNQTLEETEKQRIMARDLLKGDRRRVQETLESESANIRKETRDRLSGLTEEVVTTTSDIGLMEGKIQALLTEVVPGLFNDAQTRLSNMVDHQVEKALNTQQEKVSSLTETIKRTAAKLFEIPYTSRERTPALEISHQPYWVDSNWNITTSPIPRGLLERFMPRGVALRRLKNLWQEDVEAIVLRNTESLRWAKLRSVNDIFQRFTKDLDDQLDKLADATKEVIQTAHNHRLRHSDSTETLLTTLDQFDNQIIILQKSFDDISQRELVNF